MAFLLFQLQGAMTPKLPDQGHFPWILDSTQGSDPHNYSENVQYLIFL